MGIKWKHIDLVKRTLDIQQSSHYLPGAGIFPKDPKNETSKRLIALPKSIIPLLNQYKLHQAKERLR
jgi:integrase